MSDDGREKLYELVNKFRTAMLVTQASDGGMRARPMALSEVESDADLWFATDKESPKIAEIEANPRVAVTLQEGNVFVSLTGRAEVVRDRAKVEEQWSEFWKVWFSGKDDPNLVLLRFTSDEGEYWDGGGVQGIKFVVQAAKSILGNDAPKNAGGDDDQHQKVDLESAK